MHSPRHCQIHRSPTFSCLKNGRDRLTQLNITQAIGDILGEKDLHQRLAKIHEIIKRMDWRWDNGLFTDEQEYMQQRIKLQQELEQLTPVDRNDLERAADLLDNFSLHWKACGEDVEAQSALVKQIIERVYVRGNEVVAITLQSNCHLVLGHNVNGPTEFTVDPFIQETTGTESHETVCATSGPDEI
jgi:hypothetical protein